MRHPKKTTEEYIRIIEEAGSDDDKRFGGTWTGGHLVQQVPDELAWLYGLLADRGVGCYCEIGVAAGGFTRLLYEQIGFDHAWLLDDGQHRHFDKQGVNLADVPHTLFVGDSHSPEAYDFFNEAADTKFDTVLIDGDHTEAGVVQDIDMVRPHCVPGAWLIFHDIKITVVRGRINQLCDVPIVAQMIRDGKIPGVVAKHEYFSPTWRKPCGIMVAEVQ